MHALGVLADAGNGLVLDEARDGECDRSMSNVAGGCVVREVVRDRCLGGTWGFCGQDTQYFAA